MICSNSPFSFSKIMLLSCFSPSIFQAKAAQNTIIWLRILANGMELHPLSCSCAINKVPIANIRNWYGMTRRRKRTLIIYLTNNLLLLLFTIKYS